MLRFLLWRLLGLAALLLGLLVVAWLLDGGVGHELRHSQTSAHATLRAASLAHALEQTWRSVVGTIRRPDHTLAWVVLGGGGATLGAVSCSRAWCRHTRRYVRLRVDVYRGDHADAAAIVGLFAALHKCMLRRWWRRLVAGQASFALEVHRDGDARAGTWLAVTCPRGAERSVEAVIQAIYPNCRLRPCERHVGVPPTVLRLKKHADFIRRIRVIDERARPQEPPLNKLLTVMAADREPAFVQLALTPTPALFDAYARRRYRHRETRISAERREHLLVRDRSMLLDAELRGGLDVQHRALFFADLRVVASSRGACERIAAQLRADAAENRLVERGTAIRHGLLGLYSRRVARGEGNPLPSFHKGVFAATELAPIWHLPSVDYLTVPFERRAVPRAPAPPGIHRPPTGDGTLRDSLGPVSIDVAMRKQNTAVPGTVEQGKSSYLVATVAEDLRRDRCAIILLDPKGDAAEAALSLVPVERTCTLLDLARPTCGFNPLAVDAPADVIADYVVAALRNLFSDADIRASSDRYLRNAIIAVLAYDRRSTLWDAARLLSVGEDGYAYRRAVGARVRTLPELKEIADFFTAELSAQLADARSTTTAKLDAPVNKLARLLNSPSIKRVLLNDSLVVDFDRVIAAGEVLVVKGALGGMGAGNTSVLMQLLLGMLDAALARQQDLVPSADRTAVALKVDEAPLVINRGFAETMALKRSAGLETVACWQTEAQWVDRDVCLQLDALFAHRVYFATASVSDARAAAFLTMSAFSDTVRPGIDGLSVLGRPDARLHLPRHHAIASWTTGEGRQAPFVAQTIPLRVDHERIARHAAQQRARGGRPLDDLHQPHWDTRRHEDAPARERLTSPTAASCPTPVSSPTPTSSTTPASSPATLPAIPAESYRELVELDGAHSVRSKRRAAAPRELEADRVDLDMLALVAQMGHVLSSQLHRRFNAERAVTTTQRRLKRLADAGLVDRFQFHRRDGGGVPMCYVITAAGLRLLDEHSRGSCGGAGGELLAASTPADARRLARARCDIHAAGWALALARTLGDSRSTLRGAGASALSPPTTARGPLTLRDLQLPGGRAPHDFLRTAPDGQRTEVERFETVRPDAIVELRTGTGEEPAVDFLIELDDRVSGASAAAKLERYDHFLSGWSVCTRRYGRRMEATPVVVFVCRDRARARERARRADMLLCACRAYAGEYPFEWEYLGRERILFVAERDVHEGVPLAYGVQRLPPDVRVSAAHGDPRARESIPEQRKIALFSTAPASH